mmetsp:Transcript_15522/g.37210  ORF Transcript_15522/g.37210 Transcript_15522/m.37210 type:complete len:644 (+) Transcript_15522:288-2219(+)|eukprot:CAMPEP_0181137848 /NCGR_PEP_ID=MMETSP1071-20121207/33918_1 /TAXON_ID=35127 /ORGANISM="Thalassiosira sp., Strain NH16" /LENGTH=643 /DNA_ID=CAMNT_0023224617 /DNA_START=105 /DNA_END=2036 /DNA_ORIENTATION=-
MNSASRRDYFIDGNASAPSPRPNTSSPLPGASHFAAGTNQSVGNAPPRDGGVGDDLFEFERVVNGAPPLGGGSMAEPTAGFPLKPSACGNGIGGNSSPHPRNKGSNNHFVLQQVRRQQQMHQPTFCPSMSMPPTTPSSSNVLMRGVEAAEASSESMLDDFRWGGIQQNKPSTFGGPAVAADGSVHSLSPQLVSCNATVLERSASNGSSNKKNETGTKRPSLGLGLGKSLGVLAHAQPDIFHGKGSFPLNLTLMLESAESKNLSHIVSWLPNGQSFVIHDPDQFLAEVLPKFFKSSQNTKIRSFYRKLNRWGFSVIRGNHQVAVGIGGVVAGSPTKGVWNHPDFYRSRAVEALKVALETGNTEFFLTVTHSSAQSASPVAGTGGTAPEASKRKKRQKSMSPSLTDSCNTISTDLSFLGNQAQMSQRPSHRESDFSLGDESALDASLNTDDFILSQVAARQQAARSTAPVSGAPVAYGVMNNSFTCGMPSQMQAPASAAASTMNRRGRRGVNYSSASTNFCYRPVTQSGSLGGNNRGGRQGMSASWTAGSTISQHNVDFPSPFSLNAITGATDTLMQGEGQGIGDPLPFNNNGNVDMMDSMISMGMNHYQRQQPIQEGGEEGNHLTPEDAELASFFEKFADSLQK